MPARAMATMAAACVSALLCAAPSVAADAVVAPPLVAAAGDPVDVPQATRTVTLAATIAGPIPLALPMLFPGQWNAARTHDPRSWGRFIAGDSRCSWTSPVVIWDLPLSTCAAGIRMRTWRGSGCASTPPSIVQTRGIRARHEGARAHAEHDVDL